jgi:hypothetical protein
VPHVRPTRPGLPLGVRGPKRRAQPHDRFSSIVKQILFPISGARASGGTEADLSRRAVEGSGISLAPRAAEGYGL